jgi:hypothetical protein
MVRGATEVRSFIHQLLQMHKPPHVIEMVEEKYGHRKSGLGSSRPPEPLKFEKLPIPMPSQNPPKSN